MSSYLEPHGNDLCKWSELSKEFIKSATTDGCQDNTSSSFCVGVFHEKYSSCVITNLLQGNLITLLYSIRSWRNHRVVICPVSCAAPSEVLAIRQENTSQNSVTLLWHQPNQPNGVILEYDIKYYEKVLNKLQHL